MKSVSVILAIAASACLVVSAAAAPLEAYGRLPTIENVALSPSGHSVAVVGTDGEQRLIVVKDLVSGQITSRTSTGDVKVRNVQWAGDGRLLIVTSVTASPMFLLNARREWSMAFSYDLQTGKVRQCATTRRRCRIRRMGG